jgi:hypothetical protein
MIRFALNVAFALATCLLIALDVAAVEIQVTGGKPLTLNLTSNVWP